MTTDSSKISEPSYAELVRQNDALRLEVERLKAERGDTLKLLVEAGRRMQMPITAIKAAVSSLLDHDIFWGEASQYEFLKTIDTSVDQSSKYVTLLSLAFRAWSGELELKKESQSLQEILNTIQVRAARQLPRLTLEIAFPQECSPVLVDYEYTLIALSFILELCESEMGPCSIHVHTVENPRHWSLVFEGVSPGVIKKIRDENQDHFAQTSWENILRLQVLSWLFQTQDILTEASETPGGKPLFILSLPKYNGK